MVARSDTRRQIRVAEAIREELAGLLIRDTNDPNLSWVTITGVQVSPDLRQAKVFYAATGAGELSNVDKSLKKAASFLRRELGRKLTLRFTPNLVFFSDTSFEQGATVDNMIRVIKDEKSKQEEVETEGQLLARLIGNAEFILVATHRNPDGDAIGSLLGLSRILQLMGRDHIAYCPDEIPKTCAFLPGVEDVTRELDPEDSFDLTIVLDTGDENLLPVGFPDSERRGTFVVIDHHTHHGDMGDIVIRRETSAVGEILFDLIKELVWPIDKEIAECLYASIISDTGSFRYSGTTAHTHRVVAELLELGVRPWDVAMHLFESYSLSRQKLLYTVLGTLDVNSDGRFATMYCTPEMLDQAGAGLDDMDGIINYGRSIDGVEVSAMFRQKRDGDVKVSFRSKGNVNVAEIAASFSGGGHRNASGCTLRGMGLEEAKQAIEAAVHKCLSDFDASNCSANPS